MSGLRIVMAWLFTGILVTSFPAFAFERVFTTPEERAQLDMVRYRHSDGTTDSEAGVPEDRHTLSVEGLVHRPGGRDVVWVNKRSRYVQEQGRHDWRLVPMNRQPAVEVRLKDSERYTLKPGQSLLLDQGRLQESFESPAPQASDSMSSAEDASTEEPDPAGVTE